MYPIYLTIILLFSFMFSLYIFYIYFYNNLSLFFGKINHSLYTYSTIACIILFLPFFYYINTNTKNIGNKNNNLIFINLFIMILSFTLWMISIYYKKFIFRNLFIMIIIIVNINLLKIILFDNTINNKNNMLARYLSIIGLSYLLFHHFFIDFVLWNYYN
jgi:hypothetical protein